MFYDYIHGINHWRELPDDYQPLLSPKETIQAVFAIKNYIEEAEIKASRPVEMKPAVLRAFIAAYEEMMSRSINYPQLAKKITYRWLILNQVRRFGNYLENPDQAYEPFTWEN